MADIDIQGLWAKGKQANRSNEPEIDIDEAIKGKSRNTLYWIKFILWIEFWTVIISIPFCILMFLDQEEYIILGISLVVLIGYLIYYLFLIRAIKRFNYLSDVKTNLKQLYGYLNFYVLHYKVVIWVMYPLSVVYLIWEIFTKSPESEIPPEPMALVIAIGIAVVFMGLFILLLTWLINLIYGRKIKRLKGMIQEFEEE